MGGSTSRSCSRSAGPFSFCRSSTTCISEERESGTLALVASQPVSLRSLLLARLVIRGGVVVIVGIGTSLAALGLFGGLENVAAADVAAWCAAVLATVSFWSGLAALVNLTSWRSAVNAAALTVAWVMLVVVAPALLGELANICGAGSVSRTARQHRAHRRKPASR